MRTNAISKILISVTIALAMLAVSFGAIIFRDEASLNESIKVACEGPSSFDPDLFYHDCFSVLGEFLQRQGSHEVVLWRTRDLGPAAAGIRNVPFHYGGGGCHLLVGKAEDRDRQDQFSGYEVWERLRAIFDGCFMRGPYSAAGSAVVGVPE